MSELPGATWDSTNGKVTYSSNTATTAANNKITLTATWTGDGLTQTATQDIIFQVYDKIALGKSSTEIGIPTSKTGDVDSVSISNLSYPYTASWSNISWSNNGADYFTTTSSGLTLNTVVKENATLTPGTYVMTAKASYSGAAISGTGATAGTISDETTYTLTVVVSTQLSVTTTNIYAYVGEGNGSKEFDINTANGNGGTITFSKTSDASDVVSSITTTNNIGKLTINTNATAFSSISGDSGDYTISIHAAQAANGTAIAQEADKNITLKVYKALLFTSTPAQSATNAYASAMNPMSIMMSTTVQGANKVIFNWGDGSDDTVVPVASETASVYESHIYSQKGMYAIKVTAANDFKNTATVVLYNADGDSTLSPATTYEVTIKDGSDASKLVGSITVEDGKTFAIKDITIDSDYDMSGKKIVNLYTEPAGDDGKFDSTKLWKSTNTVTGATTLYAEIEDKSATENFFDEHGWIFIVFIVLTILALVAYFRFGIQHPAVLVAIGVFVIFAILCFVYKDFAGIWDAITGIFNKE